MTTAEKPSPRILHAFFAWTIVAFELERLKGHCQEIFVKREKPSNNLPTMIPFRTKVVSK